MPPRAGGNIDQNQATVKRNKNQQVARKVWHTTGFPGTSVLKMHITQIGLRESTLVNPSACECLNEVMVSCEICLGPCIGNPPQPYCATPPMLRHDVEQRSQRAAAARRGQAGRWGRECWTTCDAPTKPTNFWFSHRRWNMSTGK